MDPGKDPGIRKTLGLAGQLRGYGFRMRIYHP